MKKQILFSTNKQTGKEAVIVRITSAEKNRKIVQEKFDAFIKDIKENLLENKYSQSEQLEWLEDAKWNILGVFDAEINYAHFNETPKRSPRFRMCNKFFKRVN